MTHHVGNRIETTPPDMGNVSDGYHTFNELYEHRTELFLALGRVIQSEGPMQRENVWKSRLHHDGSSIDGWFIAGIGRKAGDQITYHIRNDRWEDVNFRILERAPEWDGHTSADVIERLKAL